MRNRSLAVGAATFAVAALGATSAAATPPLWSASSAASTPMCATSQLTPALGGGDAGAGNLYRYLVVTNHSRTTCHVTGFPGLSMLDARGKLIGAPATRDHNSYAPVVLRPGASASDTIHTINHQGTCLPTSAKLRIYPPGNRASLVFPGQVTDCHNLFSVTPFTAGRTGNPANVSPVAVSAVSAVSATSAPSATPAPSLTTLAPSATSAPATPAPTKSLTSVPTAAPAPSGGRQLTAVPKGAPDTGVVPTSATSGSGASTSVVAGATAGGVLAAGGLGFAVQRRRRSHARVQG